MVSHLIENFDDIDSHRAGRDTSSTAGALIFLVIVNKILEFVHDSLPQPRSFVRSGIVSGRVHGEIRKLTVVPGPDPVAFKRAGGFQFIGDVKTMAGRAQIGADTAAQTAHGFFIPERGIEHVFELRRDLVYILDLPLDLFSGLSLNLVFTLFVLFRSRFKKTLYLTAVYEVFSLFGQDFQIITEPRSVNRISSPSFEEGEPSTDGQKQLTEGGVLQVKPTSTALSLRFQ